MTSEQEFAWAAGLFEGEGCIHYPVKEGGPQLSLAMTDEDVVRRFAATIGIGKIYTRDPYPGMRRVWTWQAARHKEVLPLIERLLPYLGVRRSLKAQAALMWKPFHSETHCHRGHEYANGNLGRASSGRRFCRECRRIVQRRWHAKRRAA